MAGVGQSDLPVISAGVQAAPLVTPADPNTLGSNAVSNLVDAFRQGFITQDDIVSRIGDVAQSKNKALLQQLGEYVSPDAIKARHNELTLSDPATEAKKWELERSKWNSVFNGGVDAFQQYGPWFGHPDIPKKADESPDFAKMGQIGQTFRDPLYRSQVAQEMLKKSYDEPFTDASGKTGKKIFNSLNQDITPGSPHDLFWRQQLMPGLSGSGSKPATAPSPIGPKVSGTTPGGVSQAGTPSEYDPSVGMVTKNGPTVGENRSDILDKSQSFKIWDGNKGSIDAFHNIAHTIEETEGSKDPEEIQQRLESERGLIYTLSELQQGQAQGTIPRSVLTDWEHIVASPNISDRVKNIIGKTTGNNPLSENQVKSLISLGKSQIAAKASATLGALKLARKHNPDSLMDDEEELLNTGGMSEINGTRAAALRELQKSAADKLKATTPKSSVPTKSFAKATPPPKDKIIVTRDGRLKSNGDGTFDPLPPR